jgi:hypothetical protein
MVMLVLFRPSLWIAVAAAGLLLILPALAADGVEALLSEVHWGESTQGLARQFGTEAVRLPRPLDFGDSSAAVVLNDKTLGGVPVAVFFQTEKTTGGLKRIQLQPLLHVRNPRAFRAMAAALDRQYGRPDQICVTPPVPAAGYQAAVEERWRHDDETISAIFRDTTLQAFEGCLYGPASGWCGLHGQILVRIAPSAHIAASCTPPAHPE